nr:ATP-binding protein [Caulobacter sp. S45]
MTNLLSNAAKFTERGEIILTVDRISTGRTRFCVTDTGVGFDMADKAKVLGAFSRRQFNHASLRRYRAGLVHLLRACSFDVRRSGLRQYAWARFAFWLALLLEPASEVVGPVVEDGSAAPSSEALHILLADDHPTNRKVVELMLDGGLAELTSVEDGPG